jgi:hypothetical protein
MNIIPSTIILTAVSDGVRVDTLTQPYLVGNFSDTIVKQSVQLITTGADIPVITTVRKSCNADCSAAAQTWCRNKCEARKVRMVAGRGLFYLTSWRVIKIRLHTRNFRF